MTPVGMLLGSVAMFWGLFHADYSMALYGLVGLWFSAWLDVHTTPRGAAQ